MREPIEEKPRLIRRGFFVSVLPAVNPFQVLRESQAIANG